MCYWCRGMVINVVVLIDVLSGNSKYKQLSITLCSYHVTYAFQIEPTLYSCLNVKELLAQNRRNI